MSEKKDSAEKKSAYSVCTICDIGCQLRTESIAGRVDRVIAHDNPVQRKYLLQRNRSPSHP